MSYRYSIFIAAVLAVASQVVNSTAHAQTYSNTAPITIPSVGRATPYPSTITVSGAPASIGYLSVTLNGFSHTYVSDVEVLLVSPTGERILLMADTNGTSAASNNTLTFIPDGTATLPNASTNVVSGVYACSVYGNSSLPFPAPSGPYGTSLAPLLGTDANGTWSLYVADDFSGDFGAFSGGWSITFNQTIPFPVTTAFTYQGVLTSDGSPVNGNANVRFTLFNSAIAGAGLNIGPSITRSFSGISDGMITTSLDFGSAVDTSQALWLNIEVEAPPGSGFVTLTPRLPITPTPQARVAQFATNAASAVNATNAVNSTNAVNATNAANAASTPWSGLTGVPANVTNAFSPWDAGPNQISYSLGRVGIGTPAPESNLHLVSGNSFDQALFDSGFVGGTWFAIRNTSAGGRLWHFVSTGSSNTEGAGTLLVRDGTAGAVRMAFLANGNVGIGNTAPTQRLTVAGNVLANNVAVPSSGRFKHNVAPMTDALDRLLKLEGVSFDWNPDFAKDRPGREHDIGFVAEDVAKVFPEVVFYDEEGNVTGMDYSRLTAVAIQAIKQQQAKFDTELAKRDAKNEELKARLERLEKLLESKSTPN